MLYSKPSTYVASINVVSIYVVKFFVPYNFNLCCHSNYGAFFGTKGDVSRGISVQQ